MLCVQSGLERYCKVWQSRHCSEREFSWLLTLVNWWSSEHFYSTPVGERSIAISLSLCVSVCLSASISLEPLDRSSRNFVCRSPVAMACSSWRRCDTLFLVLCMMSGHSGPVGPTYYHYWCCDTGVESDVYECLVLYWNPLRYLACDWL